MPCYNRPASKRPGFSPWSKGGINRGMWVKILREAVTVRRGESPRSQKTCPVNASYKELRHPADCMDKRKGLLISTGPLAPVPFSFLCAMSEKERADIAQNAFEGYINSPIIKVENKDEFLSVFYRIVSIDEKDDELSKKGMLTQLIALVAKHNCPEIFASEKAEKQRLASQIKEHIDSGMGLRMSLDDFASFFSYSKFYLEKLFKDEYNVGIVAYRNKKRMQTAKQMLKERSVTYVAENTGYQSVYAFSRAYKTFYGVSPKLDKNQ